ncbi:uncharacterized protein LOC125192849 [Salvia hispanica]|uniref:uncharacterized protein LOC125192849 n=1 Tax=Salvia hispanica TaxID=49212 RepID=UPI0020092D6A|nr:uncharacterized protein LOC125192849 [Salvia hispanica]
MTNKPLSGKEVRANDVLELIHTDVCGPFPTQAKGGYSYFITFTDDLTRYGYVYLMKHKSEAFEKFKEFKCEVEKQLGKTFVKKQMTDKLESKSEKCYFVGYPKQTRGYEFYYPGDHKVIISRSVTFLEDNYVLKEQGHNIVDLEEIQEPQDTIEDEVLSNGLNNNSVRVFDDLLGGEINIRGDLRGNLEDPPQDNEMHQRQDDTIVASPLPQEDHSDVPEPTHIQNEQPEPEEKTNSIGLEGFVVHPRDWI